MVVVSQMVQEITPDLVLMLISNKATTNGSVMWAVDLPTTKISGLVSVDRDKVLGHNNVLAVRSV